MTLKEYLKHNPGKCLKWKGKAGDLKKILRQQKKSLIVKRLVK